MTKIVSYAQSFEDIMLWRALGHIENGFYIDIGAQHPVEDSISRGFYEQGWRGLHVEPVAAFAGMLRQDRPDEVVLQAAVCNDPGVMKFFEIGETGLSTGDPEIAAKHAAAGWPVRETIVTRVRLESVFSQVGDRDIHWLKVDVEGMEGQVLESWGDHAARPWVVVVESTYPNTQDDTSAEWEHLLTARGYEFAYFDGLNRFYVAHTHRELAASLNCGPNVHDQYVLAAIHLHEEAAQAAARDAAAREERQYNENAALQRQLQEQGDETARLRAKLEAQISSSLDYMNATRDLLRLSAEKQAALAAELAGVREVLRQKEAFPADPTLDELMTLEGEAFVRCAYRMVLGRDADTHGLRHYMAHLANGKSKLNILGQMRRSGEGRSFGAKIKGLDARLHRERLERMPVVGRILSAVAPLDPLAQQLARLERRLAEMQMHTPLAQGAPAVAAAFAAAPAAAPAARKRDGRQFLVDVSGIVHHDARTGIQRVVRSILDHLLDDAPEGYTVEPVYTHPQTAGYYYAARTTQEDGSTKLVPLHEPMEARKGDIFLGLDFHWETTAALSDYYQHLRMCGAQVFFVVYDLLPVLYPHFFPAGAEQSHTRWLQTLAKTDGLIGISRNVADDIRVWLDRHGPARSRPLQLGWFHLGADIENSSPTTGLPEDAEAVLGALMRSPAFLMVGTVEPRKGHAQTLSGFEQLWASGADAILVIVGRQGWHVESIAERLRGHPELGKRLFWLENASDEYLEKIYGAAACLIAASAAEGFGLPLIEAAQRGLPLIARDIPVFREVAGDHALYFDGPEGEAVAAAVSRWLELRYAEQAPGTAGMPWLTWRQAKDQLLRVILDEDWHATWMPAGSAPAAYGLPGNDDRPAQENEQLTSRGAK